MAFNLEAGLMRIAKGLDILSLVVPVVSIAILILNVWKTSVRAEDYVVWAIVTAALSVGIRALAWIMRGFFPDSAGKS